MKLSLLATVLAALIACTTTATGASTSQGSGAKKLPEDPHVVEICGFLPKGGIPGVHDWTLYVFSDGGGYLTMDTGEAAELTPGSNPGSWTGSSSTGNDATLEPLGDGCYLYEETDGDGNVVLSVPLQKVPLP